MIELFMETPQIKCLCKKSSCFIFSHIFIKWKFFLLKIIINNYQIFIWSDEWEIKKDDTLIDRWNEKPREKNIEDEFCLDDDEIRASNGSS